MQTLKITHQSNGTRSMRILALFSETNNGLGINHRLGRQILKLAATRAKVLHPELDVELVVYNDDTDCKNSNTILTRVAEQYYLSSEQARQCQRDGFGGGPSCNLMQDSDGKELGKYLREMSQSGINRTKRDANSADQFDSPGFKRRVDAIIGPSCDFLVDLISRMAAYWRVPIYSVASVDARFSRKSVYSTLTRLSPSIDHLTMFVFKALKNFKWRHLAILVDSRRLENKIILENFDKTLNKLRFSWPIKRHIIALNEAAVTLNASEPTTSSAIIYPSCDPDTQMALMRARRVARIFLLLLDDSRLLRKLLLCAYDLRMNNGEFVFLTVDLGLRSSAGQEARDDFAAPLDPTKSSRDSNSRAAQNLPWYSGEDEKNNLIARQMFESLMIFSVELPISDEYNIFIEQTLDMAHQEYPGTRFDRSSVNGVAASLHDSLLLAVEAHSKANQLELTERDEFEREAGNLNYVSNVKTKLMWDSHFSDGLILNMHINSNGDQELDYIMSDMEPEMGLMRPVAAYTKETRQISFLPNSYIHWPIRMTSKNLFLNDRMVSTNDLPPPDEPECGFNGDAERCVDRQNLYAIIFLVAILVLTVAISFLFSRYQYNKIKYQQQLDDYWWKINWADLQFVQFSDSIISTSPGSVARALKSGASIVSCGTSEVGSVISVSRVKPKRPPKPEADEAPANLKVSAGKQPKVAVIVTQETESDVASPSKEPNSQEAKEKTKAEDSISVSTNKQSTIVLNENRSESSSVIKSSMLAMYKNELVIVKQLNAKSLEVSKELLVELRSMREHLNENLARFIGLCLDRTHLSIVYEFCSRGSLQDMLLNESIVMDWTLKYSIIGDLVNGLNFIHTTLLDYHGRLKSTNLVLDSRFTVKITDFGLQNMYSQLEVVKSASDDEEDEEDQAEEAEESREKGSRTLKKQTDQLSLSHQSAYNMESVSMRGSRISGHSKDSKRKRRGNKFSNFKSKGSTRYFWTAPEHLRDKNVHFAGSKKGDVYSLAIILFEILTRREPYYYGTNAKPFWKTINKDKLSARKSVTQIIPGTGDRRGTSASGSEDQGRNIVGRVTRKISHSRPISHKKNSVAPRGSMDINSETIAIDEEAGSVVSSIHSVAKQSTHSGEEAPINLPKLNLSSPAIEENLAASDERSSGAPKSVASLDLKSNLKIDADEILDQLRMGIQPEPIRPYLPNYILQEAPQPKLIELLRACWLETPASRPTLQQVRNSLRKITKGIASKNYLDNLLDRLQNYAADLERIVDGKSGDILDEKNRTEELLYQLVPKFVADRLKRNEPIIPQVFDGVTIFFSDIIGFEKYASVMSPSDLVDLLNSIYCSFESIISSFDVTKIETIIDQFLIASGISLQQEQVPSGRLAIEEKSSRQAESNLKGAEQSTKSSDQQDFAAGKKIFKMKKKSFRNLSFEKLSESQANSNDDNQNSSVLKNEHELNASSALETITDNQVRSNTSVLDLNHYKRSSAEQIARMALCIRDLIKSFHFRQTSPSNQSAGQEQAPSFAATNFNIRIGIHSGKVCAGIVGVKRPKFCLIGDTVNVASRMHTNSKANRIQISGDTKVLLESVPGFRIESRGKIEVKGKGLMETFWLESSY